MKNLAEESLQQSLVRQVAYLTEQMNQLKTKQLVAGDNLVVQGSNLVSISDSFNSGQYRDYTITFTPVNQILGQPQIAMSFYIDADLNDNNIFPIGPSLNNDQKALDIKWHLDWGRSADGVGMRKWHLRLYNPSASTIVVYSYFRIYSVKNPSL